MDSYQPTAESFAENVDKHEIQILKDDGVYRHIKLRDPESSNRWFEIVTWPNHLAYTGDMGTYTFSRLKDMFDFFMPNSTSKSINPEYWSEKVTSEDMYSKVTEFDEEDFLKSAIEYAAVSDDPEEKAEQIEFLNDRLSHVRHENEAWHEISEINEDNAYNICFMDFEVYNCFRLSRRFIWACRAITFGIQKYQATKEVTQGESHV